MRLLIAILTGLVVIFGALPAMAKPQSCDFFKEKAEAALSDFNVGVFHSAERGIRNVLSNGGGEASDNDQIIGTVDCDLVTDAVHDIFICTRMHYKSSDVAAVLSMLVVSLSTGIQLEKLNEALADMTENGFSATRRDSGFEYAFMNWPAGTLGENSQVCMIVEAVE